MSSRQSPNRARVRSSKAASAPRSSRPSRTLAALAILGAAFLDIRRSELLAAPTAAEDCSPGQVARSYTELSRAEVERRCTRVIARHSLGPLRIGTPKQQLLDEPGWVST